MTEKRSYSVPAAAKTARIVQLLANEPAGQRMTDIAAILSLNISTCHNILRTLRDEGLLYYNMHSKLYCLSFSILMALGRNLRQGAAMYPLIRIANDLSNAAKMTLIVGDASDQRGIKIVYGSEPDGILSIGSTSFDRVPLLAGSLGRVVAAWGGLPEETLRHSFALSQHENCRDFESFMADVEAARATGVAIDNGTWQRGIWGIAAPIPTRIGKVEHILCLSCAVSSLRHEQIPELSRMLLRAARQIADGG